MNTIHKRQARVVGALLLVIMLFPPLAPSLAGARAGAGVDHPVPGEPAWPEPRLVQDFSARTRGADFMDARPERRPVQLGDGLVLAVETQYYGLELWYSDGAQASTVVLDLTPGSGGALEKLLGAANGLAFFTQADGESTDQLWGTDGTLTGTLQLTDVADSQFTQLMGDVNGRALVVEEHWGASPQDNLWASDGTLPSTVLIHEFNDIPLQAGQVVSGTLYFMAADDEHGLELWRSDGSTAGTQMVKDLTPGSEGSEVSIFAAFNNRLFFEYLGNLWTSDGTAAGTTVVANFSGSFVDMRAVGDTLFLARRDDTGSYLVVSDGTPAGTQIIKDLSDFGEMVGDVNSRLLFVSNGDEGEMCLWVSDGTDAGTQILTRSAPVNFNGSLEQKVMLIGSQAYFISQNEWRVALWVTDGTLANTRPLQDVADGYYGDIGVRLSMYAGLDNNLYFSALESGWGWELWRTDGTPVGTQPLTDAATGSIDPLLLGQAGAWVLFSAEDDAHGRELWATDGTSQGTRLVRDLETSGFGQPAHLTAVGGGEHLFETVWADVLALELWATDGIPQAAQRIAFLPFIYGPAWGETRLPKVHFPHALGSRLLYQLEHNTYGMEWWYSDGTAQGTGLLKDIHPDPKGEPPSDLAIRQGKGYFTASNGQNAALWATDGTPEGTLPVVTFAITGTSGTQLLYMRQALGFFYLLSVTEGVSGSYTNYQIWRSDGTPENTVLLANLPDDASDGAAPPTALLDTVGNRLFFGRARPSWKEVGVELWTLFADPVSTQAEPVLLIHNNCGFKPGIAAKGLMFWQGCEDLGNYMTRPVLYRSDGSPEGTFALQTMQGMPNEVGTPFVAELGNQVLFSGWDEAHGIELWATDGTRDGTHLLKDVWPGAASGLPQLGRSVRGRLYFQADDGQYGVELWISDGTEAGTQRLTDINPGALSAWPAEFTLFKGGLYFAADQDGMGRALWALDLPEYGNAVYLPVVAQR